MEFSKILYIAALIVYSINLCLAAAQVGGDQFSLKGKSFSLKSSIVRLNIEKPTSNVRLIESYSVEQHRSKIEYIVDNDERSAAQFYFDLWTGMGLNYLKKDRTCSAGTLKELNENLLVEKELVELLEEVGADQDLSGIIGPAARVLIIIEKNLENMKLVPEDDYVSTIIRNHPVVEYELFLPFHSVAKAVKLRIFFDKSYTRKYIPFEVVINFLKYNGKTTIINYYDQNYISLETPNFVPNNEADKVMDQFAFPISLNCSSFLDNSIKADIFEKYDIGSTRFSFEVLSKYNMGSTKNFEQFVAFDGVTQTLRIDTRQTNYNANKLKVSSSMRILDFRTNRKYIVVENERQQDDEKMLESMSSRWTTNPSQNTQCVVTYALPPEIAKKRQNFLKLSDLIVGATNFVYMGRALVHGIRARVFEAYSTSMPYWSDDPQVYQDKLGNNYKMRLKNQRIKDNPNKIEQLKLNILVYVAEGGRVNPETDQLDEEEQIKLLLIEVYDLRLIKGSSYRKCMAAKFFTFALDLAAAPNGDRSHELFSKKDLCAAGSNDDRYAQVSLLLEESSFLKREGNSSSDWIQDWNKRNEALTASIRDVLDIQNIMMYDLKSKLLLSGDGIIGYKGEKMVIAADFRVAEHPQLLYSITFVGNAVIYPPSSFGQYGERTVTFTMSLADCLLSVANLAIKHPIYIYYDEDMQLCMLDLDLVKNPNANPSDSKVFALSPNQKDEVYKVEPKLDTEISLYNTWLRDGRFRDLENRKLILQNIIPQDRRLLPPIELVFRIKRVNLKNLNFMSRVAEDKERQIQSPAVTFTGFALPEFSDYSRKVVQPSTSTTQHNTNDGDNVLKQSFTLEQCKAACLEDLNCRSFSYCVRLPEIQCILSNVSFEAPEIKKLLSASEVKHLVSGSKIKFETSGNIKVELVRDLKCELHNKIFMELFERDLERNSSLVGMKVLPVSGEEQCASICFEQSLNSIQSSAILSKEIELILKKDGYTKGGDLKLLEAKRKEHYKIKSNFCQYFMYLDSTLKAKQRKLINQVAGSPQIEPSAYCILEVTQVTGENESSSVELPEKSEIDNDDVVSFKFNSYRFDYRKLYEKRFGFRLVMSEKTQQELDAYSLAKQNEPLNSDQYETLKKALNEGKIFQTRFEAEGIDCARECFLQTTSKLWPSCRSFDVLIIHQIWGESTISLCSLNSISLAQVQNSNDIFTESKNIYMWHYEPRFGLIKEDSEATYKLELSNVHNDQVKSLSKSNYYIVLIVAVVFLLSVASGLFAGAKIAHRIDLYLEGCDHDEENRNSVIMTPTSTAAIPIDTNHNYAKLT